MKKSILFLSLAFLALTSCNNSGSSGSGSSSSPSSGTEERQKSPEELKADLKQQEQSNPTQYLTADGTYRQNFWGNKFKVSCTITNTATVATFKDAIVKVTCYSKTKTVLASNQYTVYEVFRPNSKKTVELSIDNYQDVSTIGWDVVDAVAVD
jgi:hypothetical protein